MKNFRVKDTMLATIVGLLLVPQVDANTGSLQPGALQDPPVNNSLAQSVWPVGHHDSYAQESSSLPGLSAQDTIKVDFITSGFMIDPLHMLYSANGGIIWGSSFTDVFTMGRRGNQLKLLKTYRTAQGLKAKDSKVVHFHGAYDLLANVNGQEELIVAGDHVISAYAARNNGRKIIKLRDYTVPTESDENIVSLNMTYSGELIYVTSKGQVGALSKDNFDLQYTLNLPRKDENMVVHKSTSTDSYDNKDRIFIVSNQYMQCVQWDPVSKKLALDWHQHYDTGPAMPKPGQLGTGSGSTPTVMGSGAPNSHRYVLITDGHTPYINLDVFDANTGELVASKPVDYNDKNEIHRSANEQSVLVSGWRAVVVNNAYETKHPIFTGEAPLGIEQFKFNPNKQNKLNPTWSITDMSVPNGIPTMSRSSNLMYAIAKQRAKSGDSTASGPWGLVGINWTDGKIAFFKPAGNGMRYNSVYAATEVGEDNEIITGTGLGVLRFYADG